MKFLIIGNQNAITYKEIFPLIKDGKIWLGVSANKNICKFNIPDEYPLNAATCGIDPDGRKYVHVNGVRWFTNLDHDGHHQDLPLYKHYDPSAYPKYDNYDAIEVSRTAEIPDDYDGTMGVPITFLDKYDPDQFEIVGATESEGRGFSMGLWDESSGASQPVVNGIRKYKRLLIRNKHPRPRQ